MKNWVQTEKQSLIVGHKNVNWFALLAAMICPIPFTTVETKYGVKFTDITACGASFAKIRDLSVEKTMHV